MAENWYEQYADLFDQQVDLVEKAVVSVIRSALGGFSSEFKDHLRSLVPPRRPPASSGPPSSSQQLTRAQEEIEAVCDSTQRQIATALANGFGALAQNPPALDFSANQPTVPSTQATVDSIAANNNDADNSDDDSMSIKSEDSSECESDCESQSDEIEIKEEAIEADTNEIGAAAGTLKVSSNNDNVSVKTEIESECDSSDSESSDEEEEWIAGRGIKEETDDDPSNDPVMGNFVDENGGVHLMEEQQEENQTRPIDDTNPNDSNFEVDHSQLVNSIETNSEHQSDAMMIEDDEASNEQSQDGPTIIFVNYEEFETSSIGRPNIQDTVAESSANEESMNIAEPDGEFDGNVETANSNEDDSEQQFEAVMNEASSEQDQAGPLIVMNPVSTTTRRSTRASASKTVNYVGAVEDSFAGQQVTLTGTRKRKRSIRRSGKRTAPKRTRNVPVPEVAAQQQVNDDSEEDNNDESESEDNPLSVIVRRLKCRVPGCKKRFKSKVQLDGHHLVKHAIQKCACIVKDCNESYATKGELKIHRDFVHAHLGTNWPCGQCERTFPSYQKLYKHVYLRHEYGLFACSANKCNYTATTRRMVKNHQPKHRSDKYRCTFAGCTSSFYNQMILTRHFRTHTKERPFLCSQCPKAFSRKDNLTVHELLHSGLKPFSCTWPHCDYSANQKSNVISHVRTAHFHLPQTKIEQTEKGIIDNRDPRVFVVKSSTTDN